MCVHRSSARLTFRTLAAALLVAAAVGCEDATPPAEVVDFVELHADASRRVAPEDVKDAIVSRLFADDADPAGLSASELPAAMIDALHVGFLLDDLPSGAPPAATLVDRGVEDGVAAYHLTADDPLLADTVVTLILTPADAPLALDPTGQLTSPGGVPRPAVIALHGHDTDADGFRRRHLGHELADAGFIVALPRFRWMDCGPREAAASAYLLEAGFSLMGLRVYRVLALIDRLRGSPAVDPDRIGLLGHSGGSAVGALAASLSGDIAARVLDYVSQFNDLCDGRIHCETLPAMFDIAGDVRARIAGDTTLMVPYEYRAPADRARIVEFFTVQLGAPP